MQPPPRPRIAGSATIHAPPHHAAARSLPLAAATLVSRIARTLVEQPPARSAATAFAARHALTGAPPGEQGPQIAAAAPVVPAILSIVSLRERPLLAVRGVFRAVRNLGSGGSRTFRDSLRSLVARFSHHALLSRFPSLRNPDH